MRTLQNGCVERSVRRQLLTEGEEIRGYERRVKEAVGRNEASLKGGMNSEMKKGGLEEGRKQRDLKKKVRKRKYI